MESARSSLDGATAGLSVRLLGPLTVIRDGTTVQLPASRKLRALFAYLALAPHAVGRSRLCELLWDVPNDPRGELRWCLSKLRGILDEPDRRRIETPGDTIELDLKGVSVDAVDIASAAAGGIETLDLQRLQALSGLFVGDFLDGLEIDRNPHFNGWLIAQRRRFRSWHAAILEHLVNKLPADADEMSAHLEKWVELAPFDGRAHVALLA
ncbi:MAG: transcriptional regulator, partial [Mesorhizobium sp.]